MGEHILTRSREWEVLLTPLTRGAQLGVRVPGGLPPSERRFLQWLLVGNGVTGRGWSRAEAFCGRLIWVGPCGWECLPMRNCGDAFMYACSSLSSAGQMPPCGKAGPCVSLCLSFGGLPTCLPQALALVVLLAFDSCHPRGWEWLLTGFAVRFLNDDDAKHLLLCWQPFVYLLRRNVQAGAVSDVEL